MLLERALTRNASRVSEITPDSFVQMQRWIRWQVCEIIAGKNESETQEAVDFYTRVLMTTLLYEYGDADWPSPNDVPTTQPHP